MKNKEKFAKEIIEVACSGYRFGLIKRKNEIAPCNYTSCHNCVFDGKMDCSETKREWAESEYIEKLVISKGDRVFLNYLKGYKYIAKDKNGDLYAYTSIPTKVSTYWENADYKNLTKLDIYFPMVKWSDSEPWKIDDLKKLEVCDEY